MNCLYMIGLRMRGGRFVDARGGYGYLSEIGSG